MLLSACQADEFVMPQQTTAQDSIEAGNGKGEDEDARLGKWRPKAIFEVGMDDDEKTALSGMIVGIVPVARFGMGKQADEINGGEYVWSGPRPLSKVRYVLEWNNKYFSIRNRKLFRGDVPVRTTSKIMKGTWKPDFSNMDYASKYNAIAAAIYDHLKERIHPGGFGKIHVYMIDDALSSYDPGSNIVEVKESNSPDVIYREMRTYLRRRYR